ncbi:hypothetical protein [Kingella oralis]|uniref:hypothetical protein n=1 Tax=Kingella oralis TaxID=505 RepID=UPI002D800BA1|nr:hypothetical protein [Kingella oralis]
MSRPNKAVRTLRASRRPVFRLPRAYPVRQPENYKAGIGEHSGSLKTQWMLH